MLLVWVGVARAGEADVEVERGRVALEAEHYRDAARHADRALELQQDLPSALQLRNDAVTAAGLASHGLVQVPATEQQQAADALEQLVTGGAVWKVVRDAEEQDLAKFPDDPEVVLPLWHSTDDHVVKLRDKLLAGWLAPEAVQAASTDRLYRLRRVTIEAHDDEARASLEAALVARGEEAPPARPVLDRLGLDGLSQTMSEQQTPQPVWVYPSEAVVVGDKLAERWRLAGRHADLAAAWALLQGSTGSAVPSARAATALVAAKDPPKAADAAEQAFERAGAPQDVDLGVANEDRLRAELGVVLRARALAREVSGDLEGARGDVGTAVLLEQQVVDSAQNERIDKLAPAIEAGLRYTAPRGGTPADAALAKADKAADPEAALGAVADARFLALSGMALGRPLAEQPEVWADVIGRTWMAESRARAVAGSTASARTCAVVATVLAGHAHPDWWAARGALHEQLGEQDAAFYALAVARALGATGLDDALARDFEGSSSWQDAAKALTADIAPPAVASAATATGSGGGGGHPSAPPATAPRLGAPFPEVKVDSDAGTLSLRALRGRVVLVSFFTADCDKCLQMLPAFARLVRILRADGTDVVLVAFSLDEQEEDFRHVQVIGRSWGELVWAPDLAERFGIRRLPTTWVVDRDGNARYFVDHWLSAEELETFIGALD